MNFQGHVIEKRTVSNISMNNDSISCFFNERNYHHLNRGGKEFRCQSSIAELSVLVKKILQLRKVLYLIINTFVSESR